MQSKVKKSKQQKVPHFSVYPTSEQREMVQKAAEKQRRSVANYILSVLIPQAEKDAR